MALDVTFKIWGVDNVVYGPVDLPVLIEWVQEERVLSETWVFREARNAWQKAAQIEELQMYFGEEAPARGLSAYDTTLLTEVPGLKPGSLRRIKIFAGLSDQQLARFVDYMEIKRVRQFSEIVRQGEPGDAMYMILEGEARVRLMISGKESVLTTLGVGDFFGEISLFDHGPRSADVVANLESTLVRLGAGPFQKLCAEAPDLATPFLVAMGKTLTSRIRADNRRFRDTVAWSRAAK